MQAFRSHWPSFRPRGRPLAGDRREKCCEPLLVRVTPSEREALRQFSKRLGVPMVHVMRLALAEFYSAEARTPGRAAALFALLK